MLVLSRRPGQSIVVGDGVEIIVQRVQGNRVTLSIKAPREVSIVRGELLTVTADGEELHESNDRAEDPARDRVSTSKPEAARKSIAAEGSNLTRDAQLPSRLRSRFQAAPTFSTAPAACVSMASLASRIG